MFTQVDENEELRQLLISEFNSGCNAAQAAHDINAVCGGGGDIPVTDDEDLRNWFGN